MAIDLRPGFSEARLSVHKPFDVDVNTHPSALLTAAVHKRDGGMCAGCGLQSQEYMRITPIEAPAILPEDYTTVCPFCWQVSRLDAAVRQRSGELVWMPEVPQHEINREMYALYVERIRKDGPLQGTIRAVLDAFEARRKVASRKLGRSADDKLKALVGTAPECRVELLDQIDEGYRLWPRDCLILRENQLEFNQFPQLLAYLRSKHGPLAGGCPRFVTTAQSWLSRLAD